MQIRHKKTAQFFSAIQTKDFAKIDTLLNAHPLKKQLNKKIGTLAESFAKEVDFISPETTYAEIAIEMAIKANQVDLIKKLIQAGCAIQSKHLDLAKKHHPGLNRLKICLIEHLSEVDKVILNAVLTDDGNTMNDIATLRWSDVEKFRDESHADILKTAVKHNALNILRVLFSSHSDKVVPLCHRKKYDRQSLFAFGEKQANVEVRQFLNQELNKSYYRSVSNLTLPMGPLRFEDFLDGDVRPKGLALLLDYHHKKKSKNEHDPKVFFALGSETLAQAIQLFIESKDNTLTLLFAEKYNDSTMGGHRNVFRIEKYKENIYIILMDSYNTENSGPSYFGHLQAVLKKNIPEKLPQIIFCMNLTNQQTDGHSCSFFSLKNISKLLETASLAEEIIKYHVITNTKQYNLPFIYYRLPARFMHVAQSYDRLMDYIDENTQENLSSIRMDKNKNTESLSQYAFHKRKNFDIETPIERGNRNYNAVTSKNVSQFVYKNNTIDYFANKYKKHVIPTLFNNKSQKELRRIVHHRDASHLILEPSNKILDTDDTLIGTAKKQRIF